MSEKQAPASFGIGVGELFMAGFRGFRRSSLPLLVAALVPLLTYVAFRLPAQAALEAGSVGRSLALDLAGLLAASVVALPWYGVALDVDAGVDVDLRRRIVNSGPYGAQATAAFWFWAAVLLGLRYLYGIPSILVVVFYLFYGFVLADGSARTGLKALGTSVRMGEGKRVGLFALVALFLVFNLLGALPLGYGVRPITLALTLLGVGITSNVTMVAGARLYRTLQNE